MDQTGSPSGVREHAGIVVVKNRSKSSPLYMQALVNTTQLQCTIEFWNDYYETTRVKLFTITLTNARINSIEYGGTGGRDITETITFRAQQITWTHTNTSTTFTDNLTAPPE
jgi:type VI secretion system Hcp family effector